VGVNTGAVLKTCACITRSPSPSPWAFPMPAPLMATMLGFLPAHSLVTTVPKANFGSTGSCIEAKHPVHREGCQQCLRHPLGGSCRRCESHLKFDCHCSCGKSETRPPVPLRSLVSTKPPACDLHKWKLPRAAAASLRTALGMPSFEQDWPDTRVLTMSNAATLPLLRNFHCSLRRLNIRYTLASLDAATREWAADAATEAFDLPAWAGVELDLKDAVAFVDIGSSGIACMKLGLIFHVASLGYNPLLADVDQAWLRNPMEIMPSVAFDAAFQVGAPLAGQLHKHPDAAVCTPNATEDVIDNRVMSCLCVEWNAGRRARLASLLAPPHAFPMLPPSPPPPPLPPSSTPHHPIPPPPPPSITSPRAYLAQTHCGLGGAWTAETR